MRNLKLGKTFLHVLCVLVASISIILLSSFFFHEFALAEEMGGISVLSLGTVEGSAVIRLPDNKMIVIHAGEKLPGSKTTVRQILSDKLIAERLTDTTPPHTEIIWIYKAKPGIASVIRVLNPRAPSSQSISVTTMGVQKKNNVELKNMKSYLNSGN